MKEVQWEDFGILVVNMNRRSRHQRVKDVLMSSLIKSNPNKRILTLLITRGLVVLPKHVFLGVIRYC